MLGKEKTALLEIFTRVDDVDTSELLGQFCAGSCSEGRWKDDMHEAWNRPLYVAVSRIKVRSPAGVLFSETRDADTQWLFLSWWEDDRLWSRCAFPKKDMQRQVGSAPCHGRNWVVNGAELV